MEEPTILAANCYFWEPAHSASTRRRNEIQRQAQVKAFLEFHGFTVTLGRDTVTGVKGEVEVYFHYFETCKRVYKTLCVTQDGHQSNITYLRNFLRKSQQK